MEQEEWQTAEGYKQSAYGYGSNVQGPAECFQPRRERCGVRGDRVGAARGNDVVLACGEMRRTVVVGFARLIGLVHRCQRGTVRVSGELAEVPDDD